MRSIRTSLFIVFGLIICLSACKPSEQATSVTKDHAKVAQAQSANPIGKTLDADTYTVSLPTEGTPLTITPKSGYKINADFPHRAILSAGETTETASVDHNEKRLLFITDAKSALPNQGVKADLSFSVCNDQMCKLYKESYDW